MPVLIEGVSVLLRKGSIHERYKDSFPMVNHCSNMG